MSLRPQPRPSLPLGISYLRLLSRKLIPFPPPRSQPQSTSRRETTMVWEHGVELLSHPHSQHAGPSSTGAGTPSGSAVGKSELASSLSSAPFRLQMYLYLVPSRAAAPQKGPLRLKSRRAFETDSRARSSMRPCSGIQSNTRARIRISGYLQLSLRCHGKTSVRDGQPGE